MAASNYMFARSETKHHLNNEPSTRKATNKAKKLEHKSGKQKLRESSESDTGATFAPGTDQMKNDGESGVPTRGVQSLRPSV